MRLNKFISLHTTHSRRAADSLIADGRVLVNGKAPSAGQDIRESDHVTIDGAPIAASGIELVTIMFNKPRGYVCSREGQGSKTIYEILPNEYKHLNSVGRLDKDSSGLLILTNDGQLAEELTHPKYQKVKVYEIRLDRPLQPLHQQMMSDIGISLEDGVSKLGLEKITPDAKNFRVTMKEGRNRQIRRTFSALGYTVTDLHRTVFGPYSLGDLPEGHITIL